ncbi:alternate-type signal peptide domain-containing protein [Microbacterium sp. NC79]|uniref:alternate-type signal peptide domain-containing protein n=1 Tax=Microbacterium sp. NC79 TaxID=2851009 RepID=UPI001C2C68B7|nr:alternate-type signal peptide domain-containing protein [Microbacterium sp. NC79]MBV0895377.1 alternate-type signal peptide domain-containing protein [Microbacterium sp. NC79]
MNKISKGALAGAAAVALLIGGGTTLAYWNDSVTMSGASITAGNLKLSQTQEPTWQLAHNGGTPTSVDIDTVRIVPGDKLIYTGEYIITAQGENLAFETAITAGAIAPATPGNAADSKLAERLQQSATYKVNNVEATGTVLIDHSRSTSDEYPVTISVELAWPMGTDGSAEPMDNAAKLGAVNLSNFAVQVTQVVAP